MEFESYSDEKLLELIERAKKELTKRTDNKRRESAEHLITAIKDFLRDGGVIRATAYYTDCDGDTLDLSSEMSIYDLNINSNFSEGIITLDFGDMYD